VRQEEPPSGRQAAIQSRRPSLTSPSGHQTPSRTRKIKGQPRAGPAMSRATSSSLTFSRWEAWTSLVNASGRGRCSGCGGACPPDRETPCMRVTRCTPQRPPGSSLATWPSRRWFTATRPAAVDPDGRARLGRRRASGATVPRRC
jgi:hypothetical protein